jgi:hypothetical protein
MNSLRQELDLYRADFGRTQKVRCSKSESKEFDKLVKEKMPLPEGVFEDNSEFYTTYYRIEKSDLTSEEILELASYRQLNYLFTIKSIAIFFLVIFLIGAALGIFGLIGGR